MADAPKFTQKKHSIDPSFTAKVNGKYPAPAGSYGGYGEIAASMRGKSRAPFAEAAGFHDRGAPASSAPTPPNRATSPSLRQASFGNKAEISSHGSSALGRASAGNKLAISAGPHPSLSESSAMTRASIQSSRLTSSAPSPSDEHVAAASRESIEDHVGKHEPLTYHTPKPGEKTEPGSYGEYRQQRAAKQAKRKQNGVLGLKGVTRSVLRGAANKL